MMILTHPNPFLRLRATEIIPEEAVEVNEVIIRMFAMMYNHGGIGLAGPQIGLSKRVFVINPYPPNPRFETVFLNPIVTPIGNSQEIADEGCLSIPGASVPVPRYTKVRVQYYDHNWDRRDRVFGSLIARVIQHENDHLNGKLIIDYRS